jgi:transposase InsO family protein
MPTTAHGLWNSLKTELVYVRRFQTLQDARMENLEGFYNRQYRHFALGYLSPAEVEERPGLVIY